MIVLRVVEAWGWEVGCAYLMAMEMSFVGWVVGLLIGDLNFYGLYLS